MPAGRPRKPNMVRKLEGNPGKRPMRDELVGVGLPVPPEHLTAAQRERWDDIVRSLPDGLLSGADTQVLERMAVAWAAFRETSLVINQAGLITRGANGEPVRNPMLLIRNAAASEMAECAMALGLSPLARTRIAAPDSATADDPLSILLGPAGKAWGSEHIAAKN